MITGEETWADQMRADANCAKYESILTQIVLIDDKLAQV